jgi:hypothetical protein
MRSSRGELIPTPLLVVPTPVAELFRFAEHLLEVNAFGNGGNLTGFAGLVNFNAQLLHLLL